MSITLYITFRFIEPFPLFHGSGDGGAPEWPPSPMRAFQALVNAASLRHRGQPLPPEVESALAVIESIRPSIIAPDAFESTVGFRAYVPHNQSDLVSAAWYRGNVDASIASHRMEKDIRPMRIACASEALPELHYLYGIDRPIDDCRQLLNTIRPCVRSISALGWGIDLVASDATLHVDPIPDDASHHWQPNGRGRHRLRVQRRGSLHSLRQRHERFLSRLIDGQFSPVPPVTAFDVVTYARAADPFARPHAVFKLLDENDDTFRYPHAKLIHIAGMVRHLAIKAMNPDKGDPPPWIKEPAEWVSRVVRGKRDESSTDEHRQFSYIPLPSIGHEHADAMIRNVMIVAPLGMDRELEHLADRLSGVALKPEGEFDSSEADTKPVFSQRIELRKFIPPQGKFIDTHYLGTSRIWHTVTPVILDGHNKKSKTDKPDAIDRETRKLICKALQRAGVEAPCEFTWQPFPFLKNCLSAHKYDRAGRHTGYYRPKHLNDLTAVHVRISFGRRKDPDDPQSPWVPATTPIPGPIAIGAGRHCGLGLFAAEQ